MRMPEHLRPKDPEKAFAASVIRTADSIKEKLSGETKGLQKYEIAVFGHELLKLPTADELSQTTAVDVFEKSNY